MIQECRNFNYLLEFDYEYGSEIIYEILRQNEERELTNIYYFGNINGINTNYKTFDEFRRSLISKPSKEKASNLSVDEIMSKVKDTLDSMRGE